MTPRSGLGSSSLPGAATGRSETVQPASLATRLLAICAAICGLVALAGLPADGPSVLQLYFGSGALPPLALCALVLCCLPPALHAGVVGNWLGPAAARVLRMVCGLGALGIAAVLLADHPQRAGSIGAACLIVFGAINLLEPLLGHRAVLRRALRLLTVLPLCLGVWQILQALAEQPGIGTAAAVLAVLLASALLLELGPPRPADDPASASANRILATACGTLIVMVALARLASMASTHQNAERFNTDSLRHAQSELAHMIASELRAADARVMAMLAADDTAANLRNAQHPDGEARLRARAQRLVESGVHYVAYHPGSARAISAGSPLRPSLAAALDDDVGRELVHDQGYFLRTRRTIRDAGGVAGAVDVEVPVPEIQAHFDRLGTALPGSRVALCALRRLPLQCFPTGSPALTPAMRAASLGGTAGVATTSELGTQWLSAYGPVESLGLGLLIARDWRQIVVPLRRQMLLGIVMLVVASAVAILLMRARVQPLLRGLVAARLAAETSEARFLAASENSPDGFSVLDAVRDASGRIVDFRLTYLNGAAARFWQTSASRVVGQLMSRLVPEATEIGVIDKYRNVVESGTTLCEETPVITPGITAEWLEQLVVKLDDGITVTFRDITERKKIEGRLKQLAQSDGLTGLPNRAVFHDRLNTALMRARRTHRTMALMFIDIDHFKGINDSHGHAGGDALLKKFAERLRREVRKSDTVARLAGDEFTVILEELHDRADADKVATGILKSVNMPLKLGEREIQITSSIGIALYEGEAITANELLDRADIALYAVKRAGRNAFVIYSPEIDTRAERAPEFEVTCLSGSWKQL